jgi:hypothetical protein
VALNFPFKRNDVFPSFFANRIQDFLSGTETNLRISLKNTTTIEVIPDPELGLACIALQGRWRFIEGTIERAHPGGAKGTYVIWAVGVDTDVDNSPDPFTDHTLYAWDLRITSGADPALGADGIFEKIGEIDWSGAAIEAIRQTHGDTTGAMLDDDAFLDSGNVKWTRDPSGAMIPTATEAGNAVWRTIFGSQMILQERPGGYYLLQPVLGTAPKLNGANIISAGMPLPLLGFNPAEYAVAGKTGKIRVIAQVLVNQTAPARTFWPALCPVINLAGVNGETLSVTLDEAAGIPGPAIANPGAGLGVAGVGPQADFPAPNVYGVLVQLSGNMPAKSVVQISVQVQIRHV